MSLDIGDKVEVVDDYNENVKVGDVGKIVDYLYAIECWWKEGNPIDHKFGVKFRDGRYGRVETLWASDLRKVEKC